MSNDIDGLRRALKRISDPKLVYKIFREYGPVGVKHFQHNIDTQSFFGEKWQGWASSSIGKKRKSGDVITPASKLLYDTGMLYHSITYKVEGPELTFFDPVPYAEFQNTKREFLGEHKTIEDELLDMIGDVIEKEWEQ